MMTRAFNLLFLPLLGWLLIGCASLGEWRGRLACDSANGKKGPSSTSLPTARSIIPRSPAPNAFRLAIGRLPKKPAAAIVRVPAGHFLTGPIDMVDNMTLQVDKGAVVLFETGTGLNAPTSPRAGKVSPKRVRIRSFSPTASTKSPSPAPAPSTDKALPGGQR